VCPILDGYGVMGIF